MKLLTCKKNESPQATYSPEQRLAFFLMSAPRSVSQATLGHLPLERVRQIAACRNSLPGMNNEDRRFIQESVARALGITSDGLSVVFCKRPRWAVSMVVYWAVRGSYLKTHSLN